MILWGFYCFYPEEVQLDAGLEVKITVFCLCEMFTVMYFDLVLVKSFFSDTKHVTCAAVWVSPQKHQRHPDCFIPAEKSWKYFCVVRWISRLYSLQCFPWIPRVPFLRLLAHAFYLCQENIKLNVFLTIAFHLVSLTCPLSFFEISQSNTTQFQFQEVLLEMLRSVRKKSVHESFLLFFCFFFWSVMLWNKRDKSIVSTKFVFYFRVEFISGHLCNICFFLKLWVTLLFSSRLKR